MSQKIENKISIQVSGELIDFVVARTDQFGQNVPLITPDRSLRQILLTVKSEIAALLMHMPLGKGATAFPLLMQQGAENLVVHAHQSLQEVPGYEDVKCYAAPMPKPDEKKERLALFVNDPEMMLEIFRGSEVFDSPAVAGSIDRMMNPTMPNGEPAQGIVFGSGGETHVRQREITHETMRSEFTNRLLRSFKEKLPELVEGLKSDHSIDVGAYLKKAMSDLVVELVWGEQIEAKDRLLGVIQKGFDLGNESHYLGERATHAKKEKHELTKQALVEELSGHLLNQIKKAHSGSESSLSGQLGAELMSGGVDEEEFQKIKAELFAICFHLTFAAYDTTTNMMNFIVKQLADKELLQQIRTEITDEQVSSKPASAYAAIHTLITAALVDGLSTFLTARTATQDYEFQSNPNLRVKKGDEIFLVMKAALQDMLETDKNVSSLKPKELFDLVVKLDEEKVKTIWNLAFGGPFDAHDMKSRSCLGRAAASVIMAEFSQATINGVDEISLDQKNPPIMRPGATSDLALHAQIS